MCIFVVCKGTKFSAGFQFNADKRGFEFLFDNAGKQGQSQTQITKQGNTNKPPATFRGKELTSELRSSLGEGRAVYISGL
ncbi:MAG: hypothetical protein LBM06_07950 [Prevotellaceae bacterium]|jgi:hypothetical protein|nr:hypothetical protein [Prevotellaceae bacterium]